MRLKEIIIFSFLVSALYLVVGILSLHHYGPNWDEPVHFGRGQAILHFLLTGKKNYKDLKNKNDVKLSNYQHNAYTYDFFENEYKDNLGVIIGGEGHPPFSDVAASFFNFIFYQKLNLLGDIESYHLYSLLLAAILIGFLFHFTASNFGLFAATISALSLGLYPLFLGEARFNIKDVPETVFYSLMLISFYKGITTNSVRWIFLSALFFSFAISTKFNIVFTVFTIIPWLILYFVPIIKKKQFGKLFLARKKILLSLLSFPLLVIIVFLGTWPLLWPAPLERTLIVLSWYKNIGIGGFDPRFLTFLGINTYPLQFILYATPINIILLSILGLVYAVQNGSKEQNKTSFFVLMWFLIPILRVTFPNANIYGGVRQIMEYIPAMAILAGIGADYLVKLLKVPKLPRLPMLVRIGLILSFIPITLKIISMYPNESIYFNQLIGGLKGAKEKNIPGWGNSLGSTYRQGMKWFNKNAEQSPKLTFVWELLSNIPAIDLRKDIAINNQLRSGFEQKGEYIIGTTHEGTREDLFHRKYLERFLEPVYELKVDGVSVLKIWKNDKKHTKKAFAKEPEKSKNIVVSKIDRVLRIDLQKNVRITKLEIQFPEESCTPPTLGYFESSLDGKNWVRANGDFVTNLISVMTKPQPKPGFLQFWFPGEDARYIQLVIQDENSCLLIKPVDVSVLYM